MDAVHKSKKKEKKTLKKEIILILTMHFGINIAFLDKKLDQ